LLLPSPTSSVGFLQRKQIQLNDFKSFYERWDYLILLYSVW
jgi:hypothetical protein